MACRWFVVTLLVCGGFIRVTSRKAARLRICYSQRVLSSCQVCTVVRAQLLADRARTFQQSAASAACKLSCVSRTRTCGSCASAASGWTPLARPWAPCPCAPR